MGSRQKTTGEQILNGRGANQSDEVEFAERSFFSIDLLGVDRLAADAGVEVVVEPDVGDFVFFMKVEEVVELLLDICELLVVWLILLVLTFFIVTVRIGLIMFGQAAAGLLVHGLAVLDGLLI